MLIAVKRNMCFALPSRSLSHEFTHLKEEDSKHVVGRNEQKVNQSGISFLRK